MPLIHVLDEPTINQIAAGEVVERPSAIVKELIENAMDAGATAITAEIKEGGLSLIRITDNGSGIAKEDIPLAFLRHATSKIRSAEDLLSVTSLGFRGEALSSIAAVSQLELITKSPSALNGFRYIIEGGEEKSLEEIGCPGGTTIIVRNIFYNTPARRKFLKSATTEAGYISDLIERLMVSHPGVSFKLIMNNQVKLQSSGNNNSKDILYHVYGRNIAKELLSVEFNSEDLKITGYIGKPIITRGNRNHENYFINGRYIKSNVITKAIEEAYKPYMMQHKYPFISLYFEITPSLIDVNVHPQKMEIRLKNGEEVYRFTYEAIRNTLSGKELIPRVLLTPQEEEKKKTISMPEPFEENRRKQLEALPTPATNSLSNLPASVNRLNSNVNKPSNISVNYSNKSNSLSEGRVAEDSQYVFHKTENTINPKNDSFMNNENRIDSAFINKNIIGANSNNTQILKSDAANVDLKDQRQNNFKINNNIDGNRTDDNRTDGNRTDDNKLDVIKLDATDVIKTDVIIFDTKADTTKLEATNTDNIVLDVTNSSSDRSGATLSNIEMDDDLNTDLAKSINTFQDTNVTNQDTSIAQPQIMIKDQINLFADSAFQGDAPFLSKKAMDEHRIIGQVFSTYWLVEYKKELYIIDQHAAHEKVLYEKILASAKAKTYSSQQLLPPIVLSLTLREQEVLQKYEEILNSLGYEFEPFGGNEFSVRAVPADLYGISEKDLLLEFIDDLAEEIVSSTANATAILERVASMSCKAAVKANHTMSNEEANALIGELLTLENPYNCPHGRPVIISMSQYELERKFKRII